MASLLRGVHPPSRWPGSPQLLAAAASQLPQQLQHMSSPVLAKLISALSKQLHAARKAQQQQEEQQQLQALLQQCGQQWLQRRGSQGDRMQGEAVAAALAAAGLQELADAVRQVSSRHAGMKKHFSASGKATQKWAVSCNAAADTHYCCEWP